MLGTRPELLVNELLHLKHARQALGRTFLAWQMAGGERELTRPHFGVTNMLRARQSLVQEKACLCHGRKQLERSATHREAVAKEPEVGEERGAMGKKWAFQESTRQEQGGIRHTFLPEYKGKKDAPFY